MSFNFSYDEELKVTKRNALWFCSVLFILSVSIFLENIGIEQDSGRLVSVPTIGIPINKHVLLFALYIASFYSSAEYFFQRKRHIDKDNDFRDNGDSHLDLISASAQRLDRLADGLMRYGQSDIEGELHEHRNTIRGYCQEFRKNIKFESKPGHFQVGVFGATHKLDSAHMQLLEDVIRHIESNINLLDKQTVDRIELSIADLQEAKANIEKLKEEMDVFRDFEKIIKKISRRMKRTELAERNIVHIVWPFRFIITTLIFPWIVLVQGIWLLLGSPPLAVLGALQPFIPFLLTVLL